MCRILVFSDSHGKIDYMEQTLQTIGAVDLVVHLGDMVCDANDLAALHPEYKYCVIRGNNDFLSTAPDEKILTAGGFRIFATHGHGYGVKTGLSRLLRRAKENQVQVVLYGHTHQGYCGEQEGILFLNPGCGRSYCETSYGIIEIENGKLKGCII